MVVRVRFRAFDYNEKEKKKNFFNCVGEKNVPDGGQAKAFAQGLHDAEVGVLAKEAYGAAAAVRVVDKVDVRLVDDDEPFERRVVQ